MRALFLLNLRQASEISRVITRGEYFLQTFRQSATTENATLRHELKVQSTYLKTHNLGSDGLLLQDFVARTS